jgi:cardiolipin synthase
MNKGLLTIPNVLSGFRIALIPCMIMLYREGKFFYTAVLLIISGLTDLLDGYIARSFNQISDAGKILDPLADKLTQLVLAAVFVVKSLVFSWLFILLLIKEVYMTAAGVIVIRKGGKPFSSRWWGKLSTALLYAYMALVILLNPDMEKRWILVGGAVVTAALLFSMVKYTLLYKDIMKSLKT